MKEIERWLNTVRKNLGRNFLIIPKKDFGKHKTFLPQMKKLVHRQILLLLNSTFHVPKQKQLVMFIQINNLLCLFIQKINLKKKFQVINFLIRVTLKFAPSRIFNNSRYAKRQHTHHNNLIKQKAKVQVNISRFCFLYYFHFSTIVKIFFLKVKTQVTFYQPVIILEIFVFVMITYKKHFNLYRLKC